MSLQGVRPQMPNNESRFKQTQVKVIQPIWLHFLGCTDFIHLSDLPGKSNRLDQWDGAASTGGKTTTATEVIWFDVNSESKQIESLLMFIFLLFSICSSSDRSQFNLPRPR